MTVNFRRQDGFDMTSVLIRLMLLAALIGSQTTRADTALNETRSTLDKWVETRQLLSKTLNDWQSDKELLEQSVQLYARELKSIEDQIAKLGTNSAQVEKERTQAEALLKASNECLERTAQFAADFESNIIKLVPQLPVPLQDLLKPLLNRMPTNSVATRMRPAQRMQVVIGVLNELDKFNNGVTIFSEKRKNQKGEEVAVETVYIGLGAAYFVNDGGDFAGSGCPGHQGWDWTIKPELAGSIRQVVRVYRNEQPARFVALPVTIK